MKWSQSEIEMLSPILDRIRKDLELSENKKILVLCSAGGEVVLWLANKLKLEKVIGLELDQRLIESASLKTREQRLENVVEFFQADRTRIPFPDNTYDALVSEFIVFPTPVPTEIGQPEMARVLKPGGIMVLTDVIVTKSIPQDVREEFQAIGLDYLCEGTQDDFHCWMEAAGLLNIEVVDLTPTVHRVWEQKRRSVPRSEVCKGYDYLLDNPDFKLGEAIFYIYICGRKP